jgi:hypothetical protein
LSVLLLLLVAVVGGGVQGALLCSV